MVPKRVLIVDDEKSIHALLKPLFEGQGYKVFSAFDAIQAPMLARSTSPGLIVLDIAMPGGGGLTVFQRLRSMVPTARIPILVYTSVPLEQVLAQIQEAKDVSFLAKPATPEEILKAAAALLGG
jgi:CheY-like chemotaxis protein